MPNHTRKPRPTSTQRGLGWQHTQARERLLARHRDGRACWWCGLPMWRDAMRNPDRRPLRADHTRARSRGGTTADRLLHASCNEARSDGTHDHQRPAASVPVDGGHPDLGPLAGPTSARSGPPGRHNRHPGPPPPECWTHPHMTSAAVVLHFLLPRRNFSAGPASKHADSGAAAAIWRPRMGTVDGGAGSHGVDAGGGHRPGAPTRTDRTPTTRARSASTRRCGHRSTPSRRSAAVGPRPSPRSTRTGGRAATR
jgi:hypothetical protein